MVQHFDLPSAPTLITLFGAQILARKELNYRKMDERDLKQVAEEV